MPDIPTTILYPLITDAVRLAEQQGNNERVDELLRLKLDLIKAEGEAS